MWWHLACDVLLIVVIVVVVVIVSSSCSHRCNLSDIRTCKSYMYILRACYSVSNQYNQWYYAGIVTYRTHFVLVTACQTSPCTISGTTPVLWRIVHIPCVLQRVKPVRVQSVVLRRCCDGKHWCPDGQHEQWRTGNGRQWWMCASVGNSCVQLDQLTQSVAHYDWWCFITAQSTGQSQQCLIILYCRILYSCLFNFLNFSWLSCYSDLFFFAESLK